MNVFGAKKIDRFQAQSPNKAVFLHGSGSGRIKKAALEYKSLCSSAHITLVVKEDERAAYRGSSEFDDFIIIDKAGERSVSDNLGWLFSLRKLKASQIVMATMPDGKLSARAVVYGALGGFDELLFVDKKGEWYKLSRGAAWFLMAKIFAKLSFNAADSLAALILASVWIIYRFLIKAFAPREGRTK